MKKFMFILLLLILAVSITACGQKQEDAVVQIIIAGKDTTEQLIMDQILFLLLEAKNNCTAVISTNSFLTSQELAKAAEDGKIQLYVDYDGSMYQNALGLDWADTKAKNTASSVRDAYKKEMGLTVKDAIGYSGGYSVFITDSRLEELGSAKNLSALTEAAPDLVIGMEQSFYDRADAYDAFIAAYGLQFKKAEIYAEADGFSALQSGELDLYIGESTNPYYSTYNLSTMKDDKGFFYPANALPVLSSDILVDYPEIADTVALTKGMMTAKTMSSLVAKVELDGAPIAEVATNFLKARSLI